LNSRDHTYTVIYGHSRKQNLKPLFGIITAQTKCCLLFPVLCRRASKSKKALIALATFFVVLEQVLKFERASILVLKFLEGWFISRANCFA
jgi:hypothetical protein